MAGVVDDAADSSEQVVEVKIVDHKIVSTGWFSTHVSYTINVQDTSRAWQVVRRYSEFDALQESLVLVFKKIPQLKTLFPAKAFFSNTSPAFVARREKELETWLKAVVREPLVVRTADVCDFLELVLVEIFRSVSIPATILLRGETIFYIEVQAGTMRDGWTVQRSQEEFRRFIEQLQSIFHDLRDAEFLDDCPIARISSTDAGEVERRRAVLEAFLGLVIHHPVLWASPTVQAFLDRTSPVKIPVTRPLNRNVATVMSGNASSPDGLVPVTWSSSTQVHRCGSPVVNLQLRDMATVDETGAHVTPRDSDSMLDDSIASSPPGTPDMSATSPQLNRSGSDGGGAFGMQPRKQKGRANRNPNSRNATPLGQALARTGNSNTAGSAGSTGTGSTIGMDTNGTGAGSHMVFVPKAGAMVGDGYSRVQRTDAAAGVAAVAAPAPATPLEREASVTGDTRAAVAPEELEEDLASLGDDLMTVLDNVPAADSEGRPAAPVGTPATFGTPGRGTMRGTWRKKSGSLLRQGSMSKRRGSRDSITEVPTTDPAIVTPEAPVAAAPPAAIVEEAEEEEEPAANEEDSASESAADTSTDDEADPVGDETLPALADVVRQGYMERRGRERRTWTRRWFVLTKDALVHAQAPKKAVRGSISVDSMSEAKPAAVRRPYCVEITTSKRTFIVSARNAADHAAWLAALKGVIEAPREEPPVALPANHAVLLTWLEECCAQIDLASQKYVGPFMADSNVIQSALACELDTRLMELRLRFGGLAGAVRQGTTSIQVVFDEHLGGFQAIADWAPRYLSTVDSIVALESNPSFAALIKACETKAPSQPPRHMLSTLIGPVENVALLQEALVTCLSAEGAAPANTNYQDLHDRLCGPYESLFALRRLERQLHSTASMYCVPGERVRVHSPLLLSRGTAGANEAAHGWFLSRNVLFVCPSGDNFTVVGAVDVDSMLVRDLDKSALQLIDTSSHALYTLTPETIQQKAAWLAAANDVVDDDRRDADSWLSQHMPEVLTQTRSPPKSSVPPGAVPVPIPANVKLAPVNGRLASAASSDALGQDGEKSVSPARSEASGVLREPSVVRENGVSREPSGEAAVPTSTSDGAAPTKTGTLSNNVLPPAMATTLATTYQSHARLMDGGTPSATQLQDILNAYSTILTRHPRNEVTLVNSAIGHAQMCTQAIMHADRATDLFAKTLELHPASQLTMRNWAVLMYHLGGLRSDVAAAACYASANTRLSALLEQPNVPNHYKIEIHMCLGMVMLKDAALTDPAGTRGTKNLAMEHLQLAARSEVASVDVIEAWKQLSLDEYGRVTLAPLLETICMTQFPLMVAQGELGTDSGFLTLWAEMLDRLCDSIGDKKELKKYYESLAQEKRETVIFLRNNPTAEFEHVGWLTKQGEKVKSWKRRFFVLSETKLSYYETPMDMTLAKGDILRDDFRRIEHIPDQKGVPGKDGGISVSTSTRTYLLFADTVEDRKLWYRLLRRDDLPQKPRYPWDDLDVLGPSGHLATWQYVLMKPEQLVA